VALPVRGSVRRAAELGPSPPSARESGSPLKSGTSLRLYVEALGRFVGEGVVRDQMVTEFCI